MINCYETISGFFSVASFNSWKFRKIVDVSFQIMFQSSQNVPYENWMFPPFPGKVPPFCFVARCAKLGWSELVTNVRMQEEFSWVGVQSDIVTLNLTVARHSTRVQRKSPRWVEKRDLWWRGKGWIKREKERERFSRRGKSVFWKDERCAIILRML